MKNYWTFLVHGIKTTDNGADTVEQTVEYISPHSCIVNHCYGFLGPLGAVWRNKGIARRLMRNANCLTTEHNFAIGHSNGCAIIVNAMRQGAQFKRIVLVNPALKVNTVFPPGDYEVLVIHTRHDIPTKAARLLDGLPVIGWFIPDTWGAMGALGYAGTDPRVRNEDMSIILKGHSDIFEEHNMPCAGRLMAEFLYGEQ